MLTYNPETFVNLYASQLGQNIWAFLNRPEILARLETATELGKPAVEGIEEQLLEVFDEDVLADRVKQMIGHMVRQILEHRGWILDQSEVKVQSMPFIKAARYKRPNWFTLHAYRNSSDPRNVVITSTRQGHCLPNGIRWTYYVTFGSPLKAAAAFGLRDLQRVREEIQQHGYHRIRVERMLRRA
jgi:hypothetical protein